MTFRQAYEPFRVLLGQLPVVESLGEIWRMAAPFECDPRLLRRTMLREEVGPPCFPWELDVLSREILLNGSVEGRRSLANRADLAEAVRLIRELEDVAFARDGNALDVFQEMHRIAHRQFPWQLNFGLAPQARALKIFGSPKMNALVEGEFGVPTRQLLHLGLAFLGDVWQRPAFSALQDYSEIGVPLDVSQRCLARLSSDVTTLREESRNRQRLDHDWLYAWNPLEQWPLLRFDASHPENVLCPMPRFLLRRMTSGLYFDLVKLKGFDQAFGEAFQDYLGEVLRKCCTGPSTECRPETPYTVKGQRRHGPDWIVSDQTAHIVIEAKAKRLRVESKTVADAAALDDDLEAMARAIVQNYRNIDDALKGLSGWSPRGLPVFPLILTLEDWFLLSPRYTARLGTRVEQLLVESGLDAGVLRDMPYTVASVVEFEFAIQVITTRSIDEVLRSKTSTPQRDWLLLPFLQGAFGKEVAAADSDLFGEDFSAAMGISVSDEDDASAWSTRPSRYLGT